MLKEMVLMEDGTHPRRTKQARGKGRPEARGWGNGGKPASAARPWVRHKLEEAGSKGEMLSRRPILGKARDTPSPKIEEGPCQATPQAAPPRGKELTHDYNTCMFPLQWDQFMATRDGPTRMTSDQGSHQGEARDSWRRP